MTEIGSSQETVNIFHHYIGTWNETNIFPKILHILSVHFVNRKYVECSCTHTHAQFTTIQQGKFNKQT